MIKNLIHIDIFEWFRPFQSFNWILIKSRTNFDILIKNWLILIGFWHRPLTGIQFLSAYSNWMDFGVRFCMAWNSNCQQFDFGRRNCLSLVRDAKLICIAVSWERLCIPEWWSVRISWSRCKTESKKNQFKLTARAINESTQLLTIIHFVS